ncbi:hypothetical protein Tco_0996942 [Tanacetum coccineum]
MVMIRDSGSIVGWRRSSSCQISSLVRIGPEQRSLGWMLSLIGDFYRIQVIEGVCDLVSDGNFRMVGLLDPLDGHRSTELASPGFFRFSFL